MNADQALATRCCNAAAPQSPVRFFHCEGAKNKTGRGPARPLPLPSDSQWVPPTEQLYIRRFEKCECTLILSGASPLKST